MQLFRQNTKSVSISVIETNSFGIIKEIHVGEISHNIVFSHDGGMAFVTIQGGDSIGVINVDELKIIDFIPVEKMPHNLDVTPDDKYLFTANIGTSDVVVIALKPKQ